MRVPPQSAFSDTEAATLSLHNVEATSCEVSVCLVTLLGKPVVKQLPALPWETPPIPNELWGQKDLSSALMSYDPGEWATSPVSHWIKGGRNTYHGGSLRVKDGINTRQRAWHFRPGSVSRREDGDRGHDHDTDTVTAIQAAPPGRLP
ncbi:hypothetical protein H920_14963 [Fukomys damarensis]|uniref:Uncharacterized protein n=1 Tax=Fukomys damarensis TaxID=885580 RepID=A0A091CVT3_FUKDA|nr:hypothetical protein H920_14963 [Fukomys damarensis]